MENSFINPLMDYFPFDPLFDENSVLEDPRNGNLDSTNCFHSPPEGMSNDASTSSRAQDYECSPEISKKPIQQDFSSSLPPENIPLQPPTWTVSYSLEKPKHVCPHCGKHFTASWSVPKHISVRANSTDSLVSMVSSLKKSIGITYHHLPKSIYFIFKENAWQKRTVSLLSMSFSIFIKARARCPWQAYPSDVSILWKSIYSS